MDYRPYEVCIRRYRRLTVCAQWAAILSDGEAGCALRDYRNGTGGGGEAVMHYGGPLAVIRGAIRCRHIVRKIAGGVFPIPRLAQV